MVYGHSIMVPDSLLVATARRFALLADPTRLRLLSTLHEAGAMPVGELAARSGVARDNASKHLARMADGGLLTRRRNGTGVIYSIADETLSQLCDLVCSSLRQQARELVRA